ncbi:MAG: DUF1059 domain-containing protein [Rhodobacteraceae bacterium]|nr:DUF1059 domain-containing protein [Paracoccaceae bacterium]
MMAKTYSYACAEFPGMESCPAHFHTETREELFELTKQHAIIAHGESPDDWAAEDLQMVKDLFKEEG